MSVGTIGAQASAGILALLCLFDCFGHRYSSEPNSDTSSRYGEALSSIANVLARMPECVCNVRAEPLVVECAQFAPAPCEQSLFDLMLLLWLFGLVCGLLGIWLGVGLGSRTRGFDKRHSEFESVRLDVDRLAAARRRAREIPN